MKTIFAESVQYWQWDFLFGTKVSVCNWVRVFACWKRSRPACSLMILLDKHVLSKGQGKTGPFPGGCQLTTKQIDLLYLIKELRPKVNKT